MFRRLHWRLARAGFMAPLFVIALLSSSPSAVWADRASCSRYRDCATCASDSACRWEIASSCRPRSSDPKESLVSEGAYIEDPAECRIVWGAPLRCWYKKSCSDCLADPACGWCAVTRSLIQHHCSAKIGDGSCPAEHWKRDPSICPADPLGKPRPCPPPSACDDYDMCASCAREPSCAWCQATNRCLRQDDRASCPSRVSIGFFSCPPAERPSWKNRCPDPCAEHKSCASCARDPNCGWCPAENACRWGTTNVSTCSSGWAKSERACPRPAVDPCAKRGDCATCMRDAACHWCPDAKRCEDARGVCGGEIYYSAAQCAGRGAVPTPPVATVAPRQSFLHLRNATRGGVEFAVTNSKSNAKLSFVSIPAGERVTTMALPGQWLHVRRVDAHSVKIRYRFGRAPRMGFQLTVVAVKRGGIRLKAGAR